MTEIAIHALSAHGKVVGIVMWLFVGGKAMTIYMKKLLPILFSVIMVLSAASCGTFKPDKDFSEDVKSGARVAPVVGEVKLPVAPRERVASTPREIDSELQEMLEQKLKNENFNGVAVVSKDGKIVCMAANGTMSTDSKKKIKTDTLFGIASCSKQITAACIMLLKQDGKINLNDTIDKFFPKYKYGKDITVKMLLNMRSGIADFLNEGTPFKRYDLSKNADEAKNRKLSLKWIMKRELNYTPDAVHFYSNSNYFLLAEIVEKVSGMSFAEFMRERIFIPLDMSDTDASEVLGYSKSLALSEPDPLDLIDLNPYERPLAIQIKGLCVGCGGLVSTAEDMDKWLTSLREHTILTEKSVKEMTKDYSPDYDHYGYGLCIGKDGGYWHVGALDYYAAYSYTVPDEGYNFFAVTNNKCTMNTDIYSFADSIIKSTR